MGVGQRRPFTFATPEELRKLPAFECPVDLLYNIVKL